MNSNTNGESLFGANQNKALTALIKLQSFGAADEEILNIHEFLNGARLERAGGTGTRIFDSYLFNSRNGSNFGAPK